MLRLSKTSTVLLPVRLRIPTEKQDQFNEGSIECLVKVLTKAELRALGEKGADDTEHLEALLVSVSGLGNEEGVPLEGAAALDEVYKGPWASFLQPAIIAQYFEQFGEARVKNSKTSRGR